MHQLPRRRVRQGEFLTMRGLMVLVGVMACASRARSVTAGDTIGASSAVRVTMEVGAHRVPCTGVARTRCLRVRVAPDTSWRIFSDPIKGFAFEEGYRCRIEVDRRRVPNPPADGSSLAYELVRVISKEREQ